MGQNVHTRVLSKCLQVLGSDSLNKYSFWKNSSDDSLQKKICPISLKAIIVTIIVQLVFFFCEGGEPTFWNIIKAIQPIALLICASIIF